MRYPDPDPFGNALRLVLMLILIQRSPEVVELAADLDEDLVDEPDVSESSLFRHRISSTGGTER